MTTCNSNNQPATGPEQSPPKLKCNFPNCSFSVRRLALLKNHMKTHSQEKVFTRCRFCSYSTLSRSNCKVHEQRMHTFQRPHKCRYCPYSCVQSSTLRQHVQMKHKERCQYHCYRCPNFYCQRESQLMFHLLKVHQVVAIPEISPYLNVNYLPDHVFPVDNLHRKSSYPVGQLDDGVFAISSSKVNQQQRQQQQQRQPKKKQQQVQSVEYPNKRYSAGSQNAAQHTTPAASQYQLTKAVHSEYAPSDNSSNIMQSLSQSSFLTQSTIDANSAAQTPPVWTLSSSSGRTLYPHEKQTVTTMNELSERSLMASTSLISSLEETQEVIEIIENEDTASMSSEPRPQDSMVRPTEGQTVAFSQCPMQLTNEDGFIHHIMDDHPNMVTLDHNKTTEGSKQNTPKEGISSSSSASLYAYSSEHQSSLQTSPVPIALSHSAFTSPVPIKLEDESQMAQIAQEEWPTPSHNDYGIIIKEHPAPEQERLNSDTITESGFPSTHERRRISHDSVSAREGTPMLDMPSPTTTHSNIASASTQTVTSSVNRGVASSSQSKFCCAHCNIIFPDSVLFTIHRGAHGFHSPFECNLCGKDCDNKYEFATHLHNCA